MEERRIKPSPIKYHTNHAHFHLLLHLSFMYTISHNATVSGKNQERVWRTIKPKFHNCRKPRIHKKNILCFSRAKKNNDDGQNTYSDKPLN